MGAGAADADGLHELVGYRCCESRNSHYKRCGLLILDAAEFNSYKRDPDNNSVTRINAKSMP